MAFLKFWGNLTVKNNDNVPKKEFGNAIVYEQEAILRQKKTISDLTAAYNSAVSYVNPSRAQWIQILQILKHDPVLKTCWQLRQNSVLNGRFSILKEDGTEDKELKKKYIEPDGSPKLWFYTFMKIMHDSILEGHTVGQFWQLDKNGLPINVEKLPSQNLLTPLDIFCPDGDELDKENGIKYLDDKYNSFVFSTKYGDDNMGLAFSVAQYILTKPFQEYRTHVSLFGIPPRIVKTALSDPLRKKNAEELVKTNATGAVIDLSDEFISSSASQGSGDNEFIPFIEKVDSYIAYTFLFSNMLADKTYVGSAEIQDQMFNEAVTNDRNYIQRYVNSNKALRKQGLLPEGRYISFDSSERLKLPERIKFISDLADKYIFDTIELEGMTGVKIVGNTFNDEKEPVNKNKDGVSTGRKNGL